MKNILSFYYNFCKKEKLKIKIICNLFLNKIKIICNIDKNWDFLLYKNYYKLLLWEKFSFLIQNN